MDKHFFIQLAFSTFTFFVGSLTGSWFASRHMERIVRKHLEEHFKDILDVFLEKMVANMNIKIMPANPQQRSPDNPRQWN